MGQSRLPAKCSECGIVGPSRNKATKEGWVRKRGVDPDWLCPEDGEVWMREEKLRLQDEDRKFRERSARLLRKVPTLAPMLAAALPHLPHAVNRGNKR